jgi:hypothetical protein
MSFFPTSTSFEGEFFVSQAAFIGCFVIKMTAVSAVYAPITAELRITGGGVYPTGAPMLITSQYGAGGALLAAEWDRRTNRGGYGLDGEWFACNLLLAFRGVDVATCQWNSDTLMRIRLGPGSSAFPIPNQEYGISPVNGTIKVACLTNAPPSNTLDRQGVPCTGVPAWNGFNWITVTAPASTLVPQPAVYAPAQSSACEAVTLDTSASLGSGGRPWSAVKWRVEAWLTGDDSRTPFYHPDNTSVITAEINALSDAALASSDPTALFSLTLPTSPFLEDGKSYRIYATFTNFLGLSATATANFALLPATNVLPQVRIRLDRRRVMHAWQPLVVDAVGRFPSCSAKTAADIGFDWRLFKGIQLYTPAVVSSSVDQTKYVLPEYSLEVGAEYSLQAVAYTGSSLVDIAGGTNLKRGYDMVYIQVLPTPGAVVASIKGGDQSVFVDATAVIDASESFDRDQAPGTTHALLYAWTCVLSLPTFGTVCPDSLLPPGTSTSSLSIPPSAWSAVGLSAGAQVRFTVEVRNNQEQTDRHSAVFTLVAAEAPAITLGGNTARLKVNLGDKVVIDANITADQGRPGMWMQWKFGNVTSTAMREMSSTLTEQGALTLSNTAGPAVVAFPLALVPMEPFLVPGQRYTLQISSTYTASTQTTAPASYTARRQLVLEINQAPTGGSVFVSPAVGAAIDTKFTATTLNWLDGAEDFPLSYVIDLRDTNDQPTLLKARDGVNYVSAYLPAGAAEARPLAFMVDLAATAYDVLGAHNQARGQTKVLERIGDSDLAELCADRVQRLVAEKAIEAAAAINAVCLEETKILAWSCQNANAHYCSKLNRRSCDGKYPDTCSSCLPGFSGAQGYSNYACVETPPKYTLLGLPQVGGAVLGSESEDTRRLAVRPAPVVDEEGNDANTGRKLAIAIALGELCTFDWDCVHGLCRRGRCKQTYRRCPNDCSAVTLRGACKFYDQNNQEITEEECPVQNEFCSARCVCYNWYGQDCSLTLAESKKQQGVKVTTAREALALVVLQDSNPTRIAARARFVLNLAEDHSAVNNYTMHYLEQIMVRSVMNDPNNAASDIDDCYKLTGTALARLMQADLRAVTTPAATAGVKAALTRMGQARQLQLSVGERDFPIVTAAGRMEARLLSLEDLIRAKRLALPQSYFELQMQLPVAHFAVDFGDQLSSSVTGIPSGTNPLAARIGLVFFQEHGNTLEWNSNSSMAEIQLYRYESTMNAKFNLSFQLRNRAPESYFLETPTVNQQDCLLQSDSQTYDLIAQCPGRLSASYPMSCPGDNLGWYNYTCPQVQKRPFCWAYRSSDRAEKVQHYEIDKDFSNRFSVYLENASTPTHRFISSPACRVVASTDNTTDCECTTDWRTTLPSTASGTAYMEDKLSAENPIVFTVATSAVTFTLPFESTIYPRRQVVYDTETYDSLRLVVIACIAGFAVFILLDMGVWGADALTAYQEKHYPEYVQQRRRARTEAKLKREKTRLKLKEELTERKAQQKKDAAALVSAQKRAAQGGAIGSDEETKDSFGDTDGLQHPQMDSPGGTRPTGTAELERRRREQMKTERFGRQAVSSLFSNVLPVELRGGRWYLRLARKWLMSHWVVTLVFGESVFDQRPRALKVRRT